MSRRERADDDSRRAGRSPATAPIAPPVPAFSNDAVRASYAFCHRQARRAGSNFYACFLTLRRPKRRAMEALYCFARHTDDLVDSAAPAGERRDALDGWRAALEAALARAGEGAGCQPGLASGQAGNPARIALDEPGAALLPALVDTVRTFRVPAGHLHAIIEGAQMDLEIDRYPTFDALAEYCHRVASAVGLACLPIWGFTSDAAFAPARSCGLAFQLTNILRDLKEDAGRGRVYLPLEDLHRFGYAVDDLRSGAGDERFHRLMEFEIGRARAFFAEAAGVLRYLGPDGRRICGMMIAMYRGLLERIAQRPEEVLARRVALSRWAKLRVAAGWLLTGSRSRRHGTDFQP